MTTWEHYAVRRLASMPKTIKLLQQLGAEGWELVTAGQEYLWFKRPGEQRQPVLDLIHDVVEGYQNNPNDNNAHLALRAIADLVTQKETP